MALFELTLQTALVGQNAVNRWYYESNSVPTAVTLSFALVSAFGGIQEGVPADFPVGSIMRQIRVLMHEAVSFVQVQAKNLYDPVDFYSTPILPPNTGAQAGDLMPPFAAYGFRTNRVRTDIDRGTKRIPGVSESLIISGGSLNSTVTSIMVALAASMSDTITYDDEGASLEFSPVVLGKDEYTTPRGRRAYRLYPTLAQQEANTARSIIWEPYTTVRSQVSRQFGRG